jgi:hypothetical protein
MKALYPPGKHMYLIGIAELAIYSFFRGDIGMTRPRPLPDFLQNINPTMAYSTGALVLVCVLAYYLNKFRSLSLLIIIGFVFWLITTRHILNQWRDHINGFKTLWFITGAFLVLASSGDYQKHAKKILLANAVVLFLFFVDCGIAHFQYPEFVASLIPDFIPAHKFFTYFAGVCLVAGGVGLLLPQTRKSAALLCGIMITGWFVLLHVPRALALGGDEWIGVGESLAVAGICFMMYGLWANHSSA